MTRPDSPACSPRARRREQCTSSALFAFRHDRGAGLEAALDQHGDQAIEALGREATEEGVSIRPLSSDELTAIGRDTPAPGGGKRARGRLGFVYSFTVPCSSLMPSASARLHQQRVDAVGDHAKSLRPVIARPFLVSGEEAGRLAIPFDALTRLLHGRVDLGVVELGRGCPKNSVRS